MGVKNCREAVVYEASLQSTHLTSSEYICLNDGMIAGSSSEADWREMSDEVLSQLSAFQVADRPLSQQVHLLSRLTLDAFL